MLLQPMRRRTQSSMMDDDRLGQQAGENADSQPSRTGQPGADLSTLHFHSLVRYPTFNHYMNVLLLFIPVSLITGALGAPAPVVFLTSFLPLIQLAAVITVATQGLIASANAVFGGFLHMLASNSVEMIVSIIAVARGQVQVAQGSLIGSILSYSLLILGSCFWFAGYGRVSVGFNDPATGILEASMVLVSISLVVPAATSATFSQPNSPESRKHFHAPDMVTLSRGTAVILISTLAVYIFFRLKSHAGFLEKYSNAGNTVTGNDTTAPTLEDPPVLTPVVAMSVFVAAVACAAICSIYLVKSIDGLANSIHIDDNFISLVVIPFAGNAGRFTSIMAMARSNKTDVAVKTVISNILLITLLIIPAVVLLGWIVGQPMALDFTTFEAITFLLSILVVNSVVQGGKASYFEGIMLVGTYVVVAAAFYLHPKSENETIITANITAL